MKNKGNTLGIVLAVLAVFALLWLLTSGRAVLVKKTPPKAEDLSATTVYYDYDTTPSYTYGSRNTLREVDSQSGYNYSTYTRPGRAAYVTYPIASSSNSSYSSYTIPGSSSSYSSASYYVADPYPAPAPQCYWDPYTGAPICPAVLDNAY